MKSFLKMFYLEVDSPYFILLVRPILSEMLSSIRVTMGLVLNFSISASASMFLSTSDRQRLHSL